MLRYLFALTASVVFVLSVTVSSRAEWSYQLDTLSFTVAKTVDTVVVDPRKATTQDVAKFKAKGLAVLAYLPLDAVPVGFDDPKWQDTLFKGANPLLQQLIAAGFSGIVVDGLNKLETAQSDAIVKFLRRLRANVKSDFQIYVSKVSKGLATKVEFRREINGFMPDVKVDVKPELKPDVKPDVTVDVPKEKISSEPWWKSLWNKLPAMPEWSWKWPTLAWPF